MSKRAWIAAFAFGLIISSAEGWAQDNPENQPRQSESAAENDGYAKEDQPATPDLLPALSGIESAIRDLISEEDATNQQEQERRDNRDLAAQEGMALWAEYVFYATAATVLITQIGLLMIWRTLHHTRRAADYAKDMVLEAQKTTIAADQSVEVARQIGEAQTRAYLHCSGAKYKRNKDHVSAILEIENIGNSPASNVEIVGDVIIQDVAGFPARPRVISWVSSRKSSTRCEPVVTKGKISEEIIFFWEMDFFTNLDDDDDADFKKGVFDDANTIWFDLEILYRDVFGKRNSVPLALDAITGPHPLSPNKKASRSGKLFIRTEDNRFGVHDSRPEGQADEHGT